MVLGWTTAAIQYTLGSNHDTVQASPPDTPVVTVTVTETEIALPPACSQALHDFDKYLTAAYAISGANNQQLDLMSEANQAIMLKDWKKLGELTERQRNLERELGPASAKVLPELIQVQKGMKLCRSQLN